MDAHDNAAVDILNPPPGPAAVRKKEDTKKKKSRWADESEDIDSPGFEPAATRPTTVEQICLAPIYARYGSAPMCSAGTRPIMPPYPDERPMIPMSSYYDTTTHGPPRHSGSAVLSGDKSAGVVKPGGYMVGGYGNFDYYRRVPSAPGRPLGAAVVGSPIKAAGGHRRKSPDFADLRREGRKEDGDLKRTDSRRANENVHNETTTPAVERPRIKPKFLEEEIEAAAAGSDRRINQEGNENGTPVTGKKSSTRDIFGSGKPQDFFEYERRMAHLAATAAAATNVWRDKDERETTKSQQSIKGSVETEKQQQQGSYSAPDKPTPAITTSPEKHRKPTARDIFGSGKPQDEQQYLKRKEMEKLQQQAMEEAAQPLISSKGILGPGPTVAKTEGGTNMFLRGASYDMERRATEPEETDRPVDPAGLVDGSKEVTSECKQSLKRHEAKLVEAIATEVAEGPHKGKQSTEGRFAEAEEEEKGAGFPIPVVLKKPEAKIGQSVWQARDVTLNEHHARRADETCCQERAEAVESPSRVFETLPPATPPLLSSSSVPSAPLISGADASAGFRELGRYPPNNSRLVGSGGSRIKEERSRTDSRFRRGRGSIRRGDSGVVAEKDIKVDEQVDLDESQSMAGTDGGPLKMQRSKQQKWEKPPRIENIGRGGKWVLANVQHPRRTDSRNMGDRKLEKSQGRVVNSSPNRVGYGTSLNDGISAKKEASNEQIKEESVNVSSEVGDKPPLSTATTLDAKATPTIPLRAIVTPTGPKKLETQNRFAHLDSGESDTNESED